MSFTGERKGRLIVFEGIDGTGKSTHIGHLRKYLEEKGLEVVQSFEPTRGRWGRMLRDSAVTGRLSVEEEVALFLKDRREHVKMLIAPALARGAWVLLDRYYLSMMAYQGARGIDPEVIRAANEEFAPVPGSGWTFPFPWRWNALGTAGNATLLRRKRAWRPAAACLHPSMLPGCSA